MIDEPGCMFLQPLETDVRSFLDTLRQLGQKLKQALAEESCPKDLDALSPAVDAVESSR